MKIVYLGVKGIANTKRNGNDGVIVLGYALLAFVGVGSATYHTNIKYWAQIGTNSLLPQKKSDLILDWR
jgi:dihydroceramidase